MKRFNRIEIDDDLGILKVTAEDGSQLNYLMNDDGDLKLGRVWLTGNNEYTVVFFLLVGMDTPILLKVINNETT